MDNYICLHAANPRHDRYPQPSSSTALRLEPRGKLVPTDMESNITAISLSVLLNELRLRGRWNIFSEKHAFHTTIHNTSNKK